MIELLQCKINNTELRIWGLSTVQRSESNDVALLCLVCYSHVVIMSQGMGSSLHLLENLIRAYCFTHPLNESSHLNPVLRLQPYFGHLLFYNATEHKQ